MYIFPQIVSAEFSNSVQGPGELTPLRVKVSGWGLLQVKPVRQIEFTGFLRFLSPAVHDLEINLPKGQLIQIRLWNLMGWSSILIETPANNTPVYAIEQTRPLLIRRPFSNLKLPQFIQPMATIQSLFIKLNQFSLGKKISEKSIKPHINNLKAVIFINKVQHNNHYRQQSIGFRFKLNPNQSLKMKQNHLSSKGN